MGTVIQINQEDWAYLSLLKDSMKWYQRQPDPSKYAIATKKEKKLFDDCINANSC